MRKKNNRKMKTVVKQEQIVKEEFISTEYDEEQSSYCSDNDHTENDNANTIDTSPNTSNTHSIHSQETILNASDSSTVDANEGANGSEEEFTYLQNLNSDNLMKFSQQSILQQLLQEQVGAKTNLNLLPTHEEHDRGGYGFRIQIDSVNNYFQRSGIVYSKKNDRLYMKTYENVYIECYYTQKMPIQQLKVRMFAIFEKDASTPVLRCQNHISTDPDDSELVRKSLVRCKNPDAVYFGCDTGKSVHDRYSVVVPLNGAVMDNATKQMKQTLIVSFSCYNSCMNRRQTDVVFLLEGMNGEILAQRTLAVKISTCPKRDRRLFECPGMTNNNNKRKYATESNNSVSSASTSASASANASVSVSVSEAKIPKLDTISIKDEMSRSTFDDASDDCTGPINSSSVHVEKETGLYVLTLKCNSLDKLLKSISTLYADAVKSELRKSCTMGNKSAESEYLKKLYFSAYNLRSRSNAPHLRMN